MSEQQSLIPNLNEIMEEYVGVEEETTLELHTIAIQEERAETRVRKRCKKLKKKTKMEGGMSKPLW